MITKATRKPGIYTIPAAEYHGDTFALSASMLKDFASDSLLFHKRYNLKSVPRKEPTPAMAMGTLVHAMLLEPDTVADVASVIPDEFMTESGARSTSKAAKSWHAEQEQYGRLAFTSAEYLRAVNASLAAKQALRFHGVSIDGCNCEQSIYWQENGIDYRCRLDIVPQARLIVDLKVMASAHPTFVDRQVANLKHWLQQAHYITGYEAHFGFKPSFAFIVVEPKEPHNAAVYMLDDEARPGGSYEDVAKAKRREIIERLERCRATDDWRNTWAKKIETLRAKPWTFEDYTEQGE